MTATYVDTRMIPIDELDTFPGNAMKTEAVDHLRTSLRTHGQFRALLVRQGSDQRYTVMAGNHTLLAMIEEGYTEARCEIRDCTDTEAVKINLADNRYVELGERDTTALALLLQSLDGDYTGIGYSDTEIGDLLDDLAAVAEIIPVMDLGPTGARYAESDEEFEARRERIESYEPRYGGAVTELILTLTLEERDEAVQLVKRLRGEGDRTAGQVVLDALRACATTQGDDD